tara:strand:- start:23366 stop:23608 length:243 start_codon:yes stop_codon:yes gene_type:complete
MQLTSPNLKTVVDYYPTKNWYGYDIEDKILKVITNNEQTIIKEVIDIKEWDEDIQNRLDNHNFAVTINTKRPRQFITQTT